MQDLMVALYDDHSTAVAVRTDLVKDGFATDRVQLTSPREHGQADVGPAEAFEKNVIEYFRTLSADESGERRLSEFARAVVKGASAVTVHPRGEEEIKRAEEILERHGPREVYRYLPQDTAHVVDRKIERAAMSPQDCE
jgi:hypothetical protein